jgi:hypothetical protein
MKSILVIAVALLFIPSAKAGPSTGDMARNCKTYLTYTDAASKADVADTIACVFFFQGFMLGLDHTVVNVDHVPMLVSLGKDVTTDQAIRCFLKFADANPEMLDKPASAVLFRVVIKAGLFKTEPVEQLTAVLQ